jgi:hypothetical protein
MIDSIFICLYFIIVHWIADFVLQSEVMGKNKSKSNYYLTMHVTIYSITTILMWYLAFLCIGIYVTGVTYLVVFGSIFSLHWVTDYVTSRVTGYYWLEKNIHNFFTMIGFDQVLHYFQLFLIFKYVIL